MTTTAGRSDAAVLVVLAGLPGSGKSAVADGVARDLGATVVSVDPIEAALWQAGVARDQPTGLAAYVVAEAVAAHQLTLGRPVVVDAVNAVAEARAQWLGLAARAGVHLRFVEVVCPDPALHRARLEGRRRDLPGFPEPTWADVVRLAGEVAPWTGPRLELDSTRPLDDLVAAVLADLRTPRS